MRQSGFGAAAKADSDSDSGDDSAKEDKKFERSASEVRVDPQEVPTLNAKFARLTNTSPACFEPLKVPATLPPSAFEHTS